jgi:hypothetical protein
MPAATLFPQVTAAFRDPDGTLLGSVRAGERTDAETRTGAARLLPYKLNLSSFFRVMALGGQSSSTGGYLVQVAHIPKLGTLADANPANYVTIGTIVFDGTESTEFGLTGRQVAKAVKDAAIAAGTPITTDLRITAIRLVAGTGTGGGQNGVVVPAGTGNTIHIQNA